MSVPIRRILLNTLKNLEAAADVGLEFTYHPHRYLYKDIFEGYQIRKNSLDVAVHRALRAGWVERVERSGETYLRLTTAGHKKLISIGTLTREKWDGEWRVVVFDIPEKTKKIRDSLRRNLTVLGFVPWQKSVWVSPLPHEELVTRFLKENGLDENVVVLKTKELLIEDQEAFRAFVRDKLVDDLKPLDWK